MDNIPVIICEYTEDSTLKYVNKSFCKHFGKTHQELLGKKLLDLIPESDKEKTRLRYLSLTPENPAIKYCRTTEQNGTEICSEWRDVAVFRKGKRTKYYSIGCEVTSGLGSAQTTENSFTKE